jgi:antitoxin YefM
MKNLSLYSILYNKINLLTLEKNTTMLATSYSNFRQDLKMFFDKVNSQHTPLLVTRAKGEDVVVLSKADYDSMEETFYLIKNPANARRLQDGIDSLNEGRGIEVKLIE